MTTATQTRVIRQMIQGFDFKRLFNQLGWDHFDSALTFEVGGVRYSLRAVAEKRGLVVFVCAQPTGATFPDGPARRKIEQQVARNHHSHIIIYEDDVQTRQVWQWVRREHGKPSAVREHKYFAGQSGENLAQRLAQVFIAFDEEDGLTGIEVQARTAKAFDVDRVTKKFYDRFKTEHSAFLQRISGIGDDEARAWYASLMLNRLMFTYFIQKKGFLAGDVNYLPNKLTQVRALYGAGQFHSFYTSFLLRLFHEGLGQPKSARDAETAALIGDIPYLNGGLFELHQIERDYDDISIPDEAFERVFAFFESYEWHLDTEHNDERHSDNEINPDVLGYIFEKYINQKQMGAYYTKEDITEYIGKNTILPFVLEQARVNSKVAFERPESEVWRLLAEDPDRYIYPAVLRGVDLPLPPEIDAGVSDVARRGVWNRPAAEDYALPTETWREHVARRTRCLELRAKLAAGEVTTVNDLITYNLDIRCFTQDVIENCEGPDLLRALWDALSNVTILDPTCGSGAFLFAALTILEPLYTACLERMDAFVAQADATNASRALYHDFRATLAQVAQHSNRRYFILKSIIISNLYGVDIMEEATEIAKLRLFLKLVAQVDDVKRLEPLPDIDFNIRAGNTLVGFATLEDARKAVSNHLFWREQMPQIEQDAADIDRLFGHFRQQQMEIGGEVTKQDKRTLQARLATLGATLDRFLAAEYGIDELHYTDKAAYAARLAEWKRSHRPFHWFIEFYGIVQAHGGFDVIIGNPPYVEYNHMRNAYSVKDYYTEDCDDLYAFVMERSQHLLESLGTMGMIVPISLVSTTGFADLRALLTNGTYQSWCLNFAERPSKLFIGVEKRLTIWITNRLSATPSLAVSNYKRWLTEEREHLFALTTFVILDGAESLVDTAIPKISSQIEARILRRLGSEQRLVSHMLPRSDFVVYYTRKLRYFVQFLDFVPRIINANGKIIEPSELKKLAFSSVQQQTVALAILNSNLFFWFFCAFSDVRNVNRREIDAFPCSLTDIAGCGGEELDRLGPLLMKDFDEKSRVLTNNYGKFGVLTIQSFQPRLSKPIIDEIDRVLAQHYGFTDEELDFIINYDIKYRMGQNGDDEGGEE